MTPELRQKIRLGLSYLNPISPQDITRRDEWIENNLDTVLRLALQQADEIDFMERRILEFKSTPSPSPTAQPDAGAVHPQP